MVVVTLATVLFPSVVSQAVCTLRTLGESRALLSGVDAPDVSRFIAQAAEDPANTLCTNELNGAVREVSAQTVDQAVVWKV